MPCSAPDYCGWGAKRGSKVRSWKNRYFVLRGRELVYYAGAKSDGSGEGVDERGRLKVVNVAYSPDRKNGLLIYGADRKKELTMTTANIEESRVLLRKIKEAIGEQETSFRRATSHEQLDSSIDKQGWLQKTDGLPPPSSSSLLPSMSYWQRCYVVLRGRTIEFYAAPKAALVDFQTVVKVEADASRSLSLRLIAQRGKVIYVAAESRKEIEDWDRALAAALGLPSVLMEQAGRQDNGTMDDTERVGQIDSTAVCEGWVEKLGQRSKVWKKRYMSLANGMLEYRKGPLEQLSAEVRVTSVRYSRRYSNALVIEFGSEKSPRDRDTICIRVEPTRELDEWMRALCDAVGKPRTAGGSRSLSPLARKRRSSKMQLPPFPRNVSMRNGNDGLEAKPRTLSAAGRNHVKRGWLYGQGSGSASWMLRYFVLSDNTLVQHEHMNGMSEKLGNVASVAHNIEPAGSICVRFDDGRTLNVYGETKADTTAWYAAFCNAVWDFAEETAKSQAVLDQEAEEFFDDNSFRGWLLKKGQNFKTWKRRYFVLERSRLSYSAAAGSEVLGSGVVFEIDVGDLRPFCLNIRFQNGRLLHVVAPTQEAFAKWLDVLRKASNLAESFLSQSNGLAVIGEEFDNDVEVNENVNDAGVEFTADDISEYEVSLRDGGGASAWIAAMHNQPEYDALSASSSDQCDEIDEAEIVPQVSEVSPISLDKALGCVGWLRKEGGNVKSWKRRYFTLYGAKLSYYKCEKGSLLRSVNVVGVAVHPSVSNGLIVSTIGGRKLILQADTNDESDRWLSAIQRAASKLHDRRSTVSTALSMNDFMENAPSEEVITHSGWLLKEGQRFKTWKKRFFTLKNSALIYYTEIGGAARGHGMVKGACQDSSRPHTLVIEFRSGKTMRVTAASEATMNAWYQVFSKVRFSGSETADVGEITDVVDSDEEGDSVRDTRRLSRFNPSDYLNDAISNDTFMRLCDIEGKATLLEARNNDVTNTSRSFKGELTFDEEDEEKEDMGLSTADADYYRKLRAEDERIQRLEEKIAGGGAPITGCAPCCTVM
ncbi:unnamed protein product [Hyaloperonospora brassicae]|uniref:PH domain-containing protein n=1 Tax=Hyaloperonospora brassicae TaxID=162125 RepID=A0AAV0V7H5_HYABA|nr:unnamed protein product [Hyaloperonospora brassicae]